MVCILKFIALVLRFATECSDAFTLPTTLQYFDQTDYTYICNDTNPCTNSTILCGDEDMDDPIPYSYNCTIFCDGKNSCANGTLDCRHSKLCDIYCYQNNSCADAKIYANYSNYFNFTCFVPDNLGLCAANSSIFCPIPHFLRGNDSQYTNKPNSIVYKTCEIDCHKSGWQNQCDDLIIYAMQGMNDLIIDPFYSGFAYMKSVRIYCGEYFQHFCKYS